jgi:hypothetical protein
VDGVIQFTVKLVFSQVHSPDFRISHLPTRWVFATVQTAGHLEPFGGRRARDQIDDRLIIAKRLATPIRGKFRSPGNSLCKPRTVWPTLPSQQATRTSGYLEKV